MGGAKGAITMMLLIHDPKDPERFVTWSCRGWDRFLARVFAPALDRRLAAGEPAESTLLMALRAQTLARVETRRALARNWEHLLRRARGGAPYRVPLRRRRIAAAETDIAALLSALVAELPTPARGVAMAGVLLRDGAGPLYNRHCPDDLCTAVQKVTAQLDPSVSLAVSA
jgi:hypothetical protein